MSDDPVPFDWNNPIPGNLQAIQGEIDRVCELCERFRLGVEAFRQLALPGWEGAAAEGFDAVRLSQARLWDDAEDAHRRWATALANYREVLATVAPLAKAAVERAKSDGDWARARSDIDRWRRQADLAAELANKTFDHAAGVLRALPRLLDEVVVDSPVQHASLPIPQQRTADQEPASADLSPNAAYHQVALLCAAILEAEFVSADQL